jgi:hypothetical protein
MTTELWRLSWLVVVLEQSEESCVVFAEDRSSAWLLIYTGGDGMDGRGPGCLWLGWTEEGDEGESAPLTGARTARMGAREPGGQLGRDPHPRVASPSARFRVGPAPRAGMHV